jgi:signal transduction histidine kinase
VSPLRRQVQLLTGLVLVVAILFVGGLWSLYRRSQEVLESELAARLRTVAQATAAAVPADSLDVWAESDDSGRSEVTLRGRLRARLREDELSRILVFDRWRRVIYDTAGLLTPRSSFLFLPEEEEAVRRATGGEAAAAPLRREGEVWLKAAYAPVYFGAADFRATLENLRSEGLLEDVGREQFVAGFVGVFAHPSFFAQLVTLRHSLIAVGAAMLGLLALLAVATTVFARRLEQARQALLRGETLSSMGRMAAGIAHEIRNPLGIIKNSAQLLREELADAGLDTEVAEFIPAEIDRLNETLTGYLEFARESPLRPETVEVESLFERSARMLAPQLEAAGVRVLREASAGLAIHADRRRLQQVLLNLMLNAMQAMPQGGTLRLSARTEGERCRIEVRDDGSGIEPDRLAEIFEPFHTTREKGSGLGLFMVRRIVEEHEGTIEASSRVGEGTTFVLSLPRAARTQPDRGDGHGEDPGSR